MEADNLSGSNAAPAVNVADGEEDGTLLAQSFFGDEENQIGAINSDQREAATRSGESTTPVEATVVEDAPMEIKGKNFEKMRKAPIAVAQPFRIEDHYGHIAGGDDDGDDDQLRVGGQFVDMGRHRQTDVIVRELQGLRGMPSPQSNRMVVPGQDAQEAMLTDRERNLFEVYRISRFLRQVALLNIVLVFVNAMIIPAYAIIVIMPILGYIGAKRYNKHMLMVYLTYNILELIGCIFSFFIAKSMAVIIIRVLYLMFAYTCTRYTKHLASYVVVFEDGDLEFLLEHPTILQVERASLC